jgi:drug/metabolite transporter (DMT)-like permease
VIYVVWYVALDCLTIVQGAIVQLLVPLIAAFGGVLFLSETITARLVVSCLMIIGGILSVILLKKENVEI